MGRFLLQAVASTIASWQHEAAFREVTGLPLTRLRGEVDFRRPSIHEQSMAKFHMFQDVLVIVVAPSAVVFLVMSGHAVGQTQDRAILP